MLNIDFQNVIIVHTLRIRLLMNIVLKNLNKIIF